MTKVCQSCKTERHIQEYTRNKSKKDGRFNVCKYCQNKQHRQWLSDNCAGGRMTRSEARKRSREWHNGLV